jgi:hypothetical protein
LIGCGIGWTSAAWIRATHQLADRFPGAVAGTERLRAKLVALVQRAGLDVGCKTSGEPEKIRCIGTTRFRLIKPRINTRVKTAFGDYPAVYQIGSGVAHSVAWMLGDNARIATEGPPELVYSSNPYANGAAATVAISAAEVAIDAFGQYMGTDADSVLASYRRRRERLDQLMSAYAIGDESMVDRLRASGRL